MSRTGIIKKRILAARLSVSIVVDVLSTISLAFGAAWVSGLRLYGCCATLGWLGRMGWAKLPGSLEVLQGDIVLWISTILFVVEFVADKWPWFDTVWDSIHTFVRIPAGAVLATAAFADYDASVQVVAFLIGGGMAATSHTAKSTTRAVANTSPEPVSNWFLSIVEDVFSGVQTLLAIFLPILALFSLVGAIAAAIWWIRFCLKKLSARKRSTPNVEIR